MSDYLRPIVERFEPIDHMTPNDEEFQQALPEDPDVEEINEARRDLTTSKERGGAVLTIKILAELLHLSEEVRTRINEIEDSPVTEWDGEKKDDVHLFFTFVGQTQEYLLREAVVKYVISETATTDAMKQKIMGGENEVGWSAKMCIDYLHRADVIGDGFKGEIYQTRNERNETVHDITRWFFANFDPEDLRAQVSRSERSVVRLLEITYGFELEDN